MGRIFFKVEEEKAEKLSRNIEKSLHYLGKAMTCAEDLMQGGSCLNERSAHDEDYDDEEIRYRQGVRGTGPYGRMHYRMGMPPMHPMDYREPYMM